MGNAIIPFVPNTDGNSSWKLLNTYNSKIAYDDGYTTLATINLSSYSGKILYLRTTATSTWRSVAHSTSIIYTINGQDSVNNDNTNVFTGDYVIDDVASGQLLFELYFTYINGQVITLIPCDPDGLAARYTTSTLYVYFDIESTRQDIEATFRTQLYGI